MFMKLMILLGIFLLIIFGINALKPVWNEIIQQPQPQKESFVQAEETTTTTDNAVITTETEAAHRTEDSSNNTKTDSDIHVPKKKYQPRLTMKEEKLLEKLSSIFDKNFNTFKKNMNDKMNEAQKAFKLEFANASYENDIKQENKRKGIQAVETQKETDEDDNLYYEDDNNASDNEVSEDEDHMQFTENFVEEGMYDGITSPYCLNCREF
jgi:hypothetical protein